MKLVLVDNLILPEPGDVDNIDTHPHLGLLSLAAVMRLAGHQAEIFDPKLAIKKKRLTYDGTLYRESAKAIARMAPDAVGFTSMGCSFIYTAKVAEQVAQLLPGVPLLMGGPHASILWREILEDFKQFSVVVCHEAEETLVPVIYGLQDMNFTGIPGVCWRDSNGEIHRNDGKPTISDLDSLPVPDYANYPMDLSELKSIRIDAGRGCPFDCTFCSTASFFGQSYRLKSASRLLEEMDFLNNNYGFTDFKLNHDLFTVNKKKVHEFCATVEGKHYTWAVSARVDCVNEKLLKAMWDAGCRAIYFGVETGSERMQKISSKRLKLELLEPTLNFCEDLGFQITCSYITGFPEENLRDQRDTLDRLGQCFYRDREKVITQLHMLTPEPGTALYENAIPYIQSESGQHPELNILSSNGVTIRYDGYQTDFNGDWLDESEERLIKQYPKIFVPHYYFTSTLDRSRHITVVESYKILRKLGHTILSYVLRYYDRRFSILIDQLCHHFETSLVNRQPQIEDVIEFFSQNFGKNNHVTSLVRYALLTENARKHPPRKQEKTATFVESQHYMLRSGTYLFRDIHDCAMLIDKIQASIDARNPFDEHEVGNQTYLLVASQLDCDSALTNYRIDLSTYTLLKEYTRPTNLADLKHKLQSKLSLDEITIDTLSIASLLSKGLIYPQRWQQAA